MPDLEWDRGLENDPKTIRLPSAAEEAAISESNFQYMLSQDIDPSTQPTDISEFPYVSRMRYQPGSIVIDQFVLGRKEIMLATPLSPGLETLKITVISMAGALSEDRGMGIQSVTLVLNCEIFSMRHHIAGTLPIGYGAGIILNELSTNAYKEIRDAYSQMKLSPFIILNASSPDDVKSYGTVVSIFKLLLGGDKIITPCTSYSDFYEKLKTST